MSDHVLQARRQAGAPAVRNAPAKATTSDLPESAGGLDQLHAALNDAPKVKQAMQLRSSLSQSLRVGQLARVAQMAQRVSAPGRVVQRLELTDAIWKHIAQGELRDGKKLVGYHWTGDTGAIARKNGTKKEGPDARGVYVEGVETIEQFGQGKKKGPIVKGPASTFWPDAWSAAEIKNAIANGGTARNTKSEVSTKATKAEARGMILTVNPDSIFPEIGETAEPQGKSKGKGKRS